MRRREAIGLLATAAVPGCSSYPKTKAPARVSILKAARYGPELYEVLRRIVADYKLDVRGKQVVLKPNLVDYDPVRPIYTHPVLVHAAIEAFRAAGAAAVRICEGPASISPMRQDISQPYLTSSASSSMPTWTKLRAYGSNHRTQTFERSTCPTPRSAAICWCRCRR
jgi:hypothetical protein